MYREEAVVVVAKISLSPPESDPDRVGAVLKITEAVPAFGGFGLKLVLGAGHEGLPHLVLALDSSGIFQLTGDELAVAVLVRGGCTSKFGWYSGVIRSLPRVVFGHRRVHHAGVVGWYFTTNLSLFLHLFSSYLPSFIYLLPSCFPPNSLLILTYIPLFPSYFSVIRCT